jgi:hypothetical protein
MAFQDQLFEKHWLVLSSLDSLKFTPVEVPMSEA